MTKEKELIEAQREYIKFLAKNIGENAVFLHTHGIKTSEEDVLKGKEYRDKIKLLESHQQESQESEYDRGYKDGATEAQQEERNKQERSKPFYW